jgi:hypothetical protein
VFDAIRVNEHVASRWWQTACAIMTVATIIVGVLWWNWDMRILVLLYWVENLFLGILQIVKIAFSRSVSHSSSLSWLLRGFIILFFMVHYGGFCGGHGLFLLIISGNGGPRVLSEMSFAWGPLVFLDLLRVVTIQIWQVIPSSAWFSIAGIALGRLVEVIRERDRWLEQSPKDLMQEPYKHIIVVHIAIIIGMFFAMILKNPMPVLGLIVIGKFMIDLREIWQSRPTRAVAMRESSLS